MVFRGFWPRPLPLNPTLAGARWGAGSSACDRQQKPAPCGRVRLGRNRVSPSEAAGVGSGLGAIAILGGNGARHAGAGRTSPEGGKSGTGSSGLGLAHLIPLGFWPDPWLLALGDGSILTPVSLPARPFLARQLCAGFPSLFGDFRPAGSGERPGAGEAAEAGHVGDEHAGMVAVRRPGQAATNCTAAQGPRCCRGRG